jgi:DNA-binding transcriptional MerR regulator
MRCAGERRRIDVIGHCAILPVPHSGSDARQSKTMDGRAPLTSATEPGGIRPASRFAGDNTTYTTKQVTQICGVSRRQIQWWAEHDVIPVNLIGGWRCFNPADLQKIFILADLRRKGVSLQSARRLLSSISACLAQRAGQEFFVVVAGTAEHDTRFVYKSVAVADTAEEVIRFVSSAEHACIVCHSNAAIQSEGAMGARLPF